MGNNLQIRFTRMSDSLTLQDWLKEVEVQNYFPIYADCEAQDVAVRWVSFSRYQSSLTAEIEGKMVGLVTLYLQPYKKIMHQSELGIIVAPGYRGRGIGSTLLDEVEKLAKKDFEIALLHLQVYFDNPAIHLYQRKGFQVFGQQRKFMKTEEGLFRGRTYMEKELLIP